MATSAFDATLVGSPSVASTAASYSSSASAANFGNALALNGSSQYASVPTTPVEFAAGSSWTVSLRVRTSSSSGTQVIFGKGSVNSSPTDTWWIGTVSGVLKASITGFSAGATFGTANIADGNWHNIALVVSLGNSATLYVDGTAAGTSSGTFVSGAHHVDNRLTIGALFAALATAGFFFNGQVDEIAVYNDAIYTGTYTPSTSPVSATATSLVALWHFDGDALDSCDLGTASSVYTNNWDSETAGTQPTGWVNGAGTWLVGTTNPVSGAQTFGSTTKGVGDTVVYSGGSAIANVDVLTKQKLAAFSSSNVPAVGTFVRGDGTLANGYLVAVGSSGTGGTLLINVFKRISGTYTQLGTSARVSGFASNDTLFIRVRIIGRSILVRIWANSGEPTTWQMVIGDGSITAAGYVGFYYGTDTGGAGQSFAVDDLTISTLAAATTATLTGPSSGTTGSASSNFTITLDAPASGTINFTLAGTVGSHTFSPSTPQITAGNSSVTFTDTAVSDGAHAISMTNDGGLANAGSPLTYTTTTPSAPTSVTLTGPTTGSTGSASSNFTVTLDQPALVAVTVTPAGTVGTNTFTPSTVVIAVGQTTGTFTDTALSDGTHVISITNDRSLSNVGTVSYVTSTVSSPTIAVNDANVLAGLSPYNWETSGSSYIRAINPGAYLQFKWDKTSLTMNIDTSAFSALALAAKRYPVVAWRIDDGAFQTSQLTSGQTTLSLASGLAAGTHTVWLTLLGTDAYSARWAGVNCLKITSFTSASGVATTAASLRTKRMLVFGDSITEGAWSLGGPSDLTNYATYDSALVSYAASLAQAFDAEFGNCAFGGQSFDTTFNSDIPRLGLAWDSVLSGVSRLTAGAFTTTPDYLFCVMGANGGLASAATLTNLMVAWRAAAGSACRIFIVIPFGQTGVTNITTGFNDYVTAHGSDTKVHLINLGTIAGITASSSTATSLGTDGLHPNTYGHARLGAMLAKAAQAAIGGTTSAAGVGFSRLQGGH